MAEPLKAGMPPDLDIIGDYRVRLTAVSPTTGAVVFGVIVSGVAIQATNLGSPLDELAPLPRLVPTDQLV